MTERKHDAAKMFLPALLAIVLAVLTLISCEGEGAVNDLPCGVLLRINEPKTLEATRNDIVAYYTYDADYLSSSESVYGERTGESLFVSEEGTAVLRYFTTGLYRIDVWAFNSSGTILYHGTNTVYVRHGENVCDIVLESPREQSGTLEIDITAIKTGTDRMSCRFERYDGSETIEYTSFTVTTEGNDVRYTTSMTLAEGPWKATFSLITTEVIAKETIDLHIVRNETVKLEGSMYPFRDEEGSISVTDPEAITGRIEVSADMSRVSFVAETGTPTSFVWYINGIVQDSRKQIKMTDASGTYLYGTVTADGSSLVPSFPHTGTYTYSCRVTGESGESGYAVKRIYIDGGSH